MTPVQNAEKEKHWVEVNLDTVIDIEELNDGIFICTMVIRVHPLVYGSAAWLVAEFCDRVFRFYDEQCGVPYDALQSKFSGHRSTTIRRWKKEQSIVPPLDDVIDAPL